LVAIRKRREKLGGTLPAALNPSANGPIPAHVYLNLINKQIEVLNQQYKTRCDVFNQFFDNLEKQVIQMRHQAFQELDSYRLQTLNEISNLQKFFKAEGNVNLSFNERKEQLIMEQNRLKKLLMEHSGNDADCAEESEGKEPL